MMTAPKIKARWLLKNVRGDVAFEDVSFAYIDEQYVLKNISFNIKAGETLAIVGIPAAVKLPSSVY